MEVFAFLKDIVRSGFVSRDPDFFVKHILDLFGEFLFDIPQIFVFFLFVVTLVTSLGTIMYMIEGDLPGTQFTNIPKSIYWAIVTMTTVGYGDVTPVTGLGRFLSSLVMLLGYTIMAVPTGIVSVSMMNLRDTEKREATQEDSDEVEEDNMRIVERMKTEDEEFLADDEPNYCPYCGGSILFSGANFCPHCGRNLKV